MPIRGQHTTARAALLIMRGLAGDLLKHLLHWGTPTTARLWDDQGLDYDSTLSYADRPGFRCGTCREYPLYDLHQRRPLRLRERPLIVMECSVIAEHYLGLGYSDEALALMQGYRDTCHRFGGTSPCCGITPISTTKQTGDSMTLWWPESARSCRPGSKT